MTIGFQPSTRFAFLEESDLPTLSETKEDALYFSHADRPKGTAFIVGHVLLTLLFFGACRELPWAIHLARVATTE